MPTVKQFIATLESIEDAGPRSLVAFLYLSGCRISEALSIKAGQLEMVDGDLWIRNVPILKRREPIPRIVTVAIDEERIFRHITNWAEGKDANKLLWPYRRWDAWEMVKENTTYFPHFFRHLRVTHLFEYTDLRDMEILNIIGWKNPQMLTIYSHLRQSDALKKMKGSRLGKA